MNISEADFARCSESRNGAGTARFGTRMSKVPDAGDRAPWRARLRFAVDGLTAASIIRPVAGAKPWTLMRGQSGTVRSICLHSLGTRNRAPRFMEKLHRARHLLYATNGQARRRRRTGAGRRPEQSDRLRTCRGSPGPARCRIVGQVRSSDAAAILRTSAQGDEDHACNRQQAATAPAATSGCRAPRDDGEERVFMRQGCGVARC